MRKIGNGEPCFITLEAGPTHDGIEAAMGLATVAAEAGADAVKFQIVDADRLVANRAQQFGYEVLLDRVSGKTEAVEESLYEILKRRQLTPKEWRAVKAHCDKLGIAFFATVTFEDELTLVAELKCAAVKIASGDVNHFPLLRLAARTGLGVQLDTGNSTLGEIETAVDVIRAAGDPQIVIHHCPPGYPSPAEKVNLRILQTLKQMFQTPVAFSDHSPGWDMMIASVVLGVDLIEKTITFDRTTRSPEHMFSLEPEDAKRFVNAIRDVEKAMGQTRRLMTPEERKKRDAVRRSAFLAEPAKAGAALADLKFDYRRPGYGIGPDEIEKLLDLKLRTDLPSGHMLTRADVG